MEYNTSSAKRQRINFACAEALYWAFFSVFGGYAVAFGLNRGFTQEQCSRFISVCLL